MALQILNSLLARDKHEAGAYAVFSVGECTLSLSGTFVSSPNIYIYICMYNMEGLPFSRKQKNGYAQLRYVM